MQIQNEFYDNTREARTPQNELYVNTRMRNRRRKLNILLLGETGAGKSTLINFWCNLIKFAMFTMAAASRILCPIRMDIQLIDQNLQAHQISHGGDENERNNISPSPVGASATQHCRSYVIKTPAMDMIVTDTPGMGDTGDENTGDTGDENKGNIKDMEHLEMVQDYIAAYRMIDLIVVLMQNQANRYHDRFQDCMTKLFQQLHAGAANNVVFLFTHATDFEAGSAVGVVKRWVEELERKHGIKIPYGRDQVYFIDSGVLLRLVGKENGIPIDENRRESLNSAWIRSANEIWRMLQYASTLPPHRTEETVSLNDARSLLVCLNAPLAGVTERGNQLLTRIKSIEESLQKDDGTIEKAQEDLAVLEKQYKIEYKDFDYTFVIGWLWAACKFGYSKFHEGRYNTANACLNVLKAERITKEEGLNNLKTKINSFMNEKTILLETAAKFACFLRKYSMTEYEDAFRKHMKESIEKMKSDNRPLPLLWTNTSDKAIESMEADLRQYEEIKRTINVTAMSPSTIQELINALFNLEHLGPGLKQLLESEKAKRRQRVVQEQIIPIHFDG